jgi:hypothetical protein
MPAVMIFQAEATEGDLPPVCVYCGDAASGFYWMGLFGRQRGFKHLPLCELHRLRWRWLTAIANTAVVVSLVLLALGALVMALEEPGGGRGPGLFIWIGAILFLPVASVVYFTIFYFAIKALPTTARTWRLNGVAANRRGNLVPRCASLDFPSAESSEPEVLDRISPRRRLHYRDLLPWSGAVHGRRWR